MAPKETDKEPAEGVDMKPDSDADDDVDEDAGQNSDEEIANESDDGIPDETNGLAAKGTKREKAEEGQPEGLGANAYEVIDVEKGKKPKALPEDVEEEGLKAKFERKRVRVDARLGPKLRGALDAEGKALL